MNDDVMDSLLILNVLAAVPLLYLIIMIYTGDIEIGAYQLLCTLSIIVWFASLFMMAVYHYDGSLWLRIFVTICAVFLTLITFISRSITFSPFFNIAIIILLVNYCIYALEFTNINNGDRY